MISKKLLLYILTILISSAGYAQFTPDNFYFQNENKFLQKISSDNPASNSISDIIVVGDTVWLGTSRSVSLSTDGGENWTNFYSTSPLGDESISAIGYNNGTFWAATANSVDVSGQSLPQGTGLKFTTDLGQTWTSIPQPIDAADDSVEIYGTNHIRALPVTVTIQNLTYDIAFTKNTVWISSFAGGLRKSTDNGQSWQRVVIPPDYLNEIKPTDTLNFCLSPVAGNFCAENNLNHRVFSVIGVNDSTLYVGTAGGINKSTDNGISWIKFNHTNQDEPISGNFVVALGYDSANDIIWGATWKAEGEAEFYGISSSSNGGDTWQTFLEDERAHNFGFASGDVITTTDNGAFRSSSNGISWILPGSIIDNKTNLKLATNIFYSAASNDVNTFLGSADGLVRYTESSAGPWAGEWKLFIASQQLSSTTETYAYPNPFSPKLDQLKIKYSTGGKTASVTIRVFDFAMNYVSTVVQNVQRGNSFNQIDGNTVEANGVIDFWDGKDAAGNIVPNGVYFYRVEVDGADPVFGKILVLQ